KTKIHWNSTYLAWKWVLELHIAMKLVSTILLLKKDCSSQLEGEKLDRLYLTIDKKNFIQNIVNLLSPFEIVTHYICEKLSDTDNSSSVNEDKNISSAGDNDFFAKVFNLGGSNNDIIEFEEDEISQYLKYPEAKPNEDLLIWWNSRKTYSMITC
ncbi:8110_t:CDS:2, partial [Scutellospora calospora]